MTKPPNPGSEAAFKMGCTCPRMDNCYGAGAYGNDLFWMNGDCPIHAEKVQASSGEMKKIPYKKETDDTRT